MPNDAPDLSPARLEQLLAAATPGPWTQHLVDETLVVSGLLEIASTNIDGTYDESFRRMAADAALIALSPTLAARVVELEGEVERLRGALRAIASHGNNCGCHQATFINIARAALEPDA